MPLPTSVARTVKGCVCPAQAHVKHPSRLRAVPGPFRAIAGGGCAPPPSLPAPLRGLSVNTGSDARHTSRPHPAWRHWRLPRV